MVCIFALHLPRNQAPHSVGQDHVSNIELLSFFDMRFVFAMALDILRAANYHVPQEIFLA